MARYSPVFSAPFIYYTDSTPNTEFEVPAGFTAVVRQITAVCEAGGLALTASIQDAGVGPPIVFFAKSVFGVFEYVAQELRVVAPENSLIELSLSSEALATAVYVGGYLLQNTLP